MRVTLKIILNSNSILCLSIIIYKYKNSNVHTRIKKTSNQVSNNQEFSEISRMRLNNHLEEWISLKLDNTKNRTSKDKKYKNRAK
jgi:hypothetical protein